MLRIFYGQFRFIVYVSRYLSDVVLPRPRLWHFDTPHRMFIARVAYEKKKQQQQQQQQQPKIKQTCCVIAFILLQTFPIFRSCLK